MTSIEDDFFDEDEDHEEAWLKCPHCSEEIYGDAEQCAACGYYITDEEFGETTTPQIPLWVRLTAMVLICMFIYAVVAPFL